MSEQLKEMLFEEWAGSTYTLGQKPVMVSLPPKMCTRCKEVKPLEEFHNHSRTPDGKNVRCKECACRASKEWRDQRVKDDSDFYTHPEKKAYQKTWRKSNPEKVRRYGRKNKLQTFYGVSEQKYEDMLEFQNGRCAICGKSQHDEARALSVDHDHKTGKVRGLLCGTCNLALGVLEDRLVETTKYLEEPPYASLG